MPENSGLQELIAKTSSTVAEPEFFRQTLSKITALFSKFLNLATTKIVMSSFPYFKLGSTTKNFDEELVFLKFKLGSQFMPFDTNVGPEATVILFAS